MNSSDNSRFRYKKVPNIAIFSETGIPPLDLYTKYRHNLLALRARTLNRHTAWSNKWLHDSGIKDIIQYSFSQKQGKSWIKANMIRLWRETIEDSDLRYKGKPRTKWTHLRKVTRTQLRDIMYLRATAGWPYQDFKGNRYTCRCGRDIITPYHLMNTCADVTHTTLDLHSNKTIKELAKWIESWPAHLRRVPGSQKIPDPNYAQVQGAAINLPTSQPTVPRVTYRAGHKYIACDICNKPVRSTRETKDKHARTHEPGYKKGGDTRKTKSSGGPSS